LSSESRPRAPVVPTAARALKDFFALVDEIRTSIIDRDFGDLPPSYQDALNSVNRILDNAIRTAESGTGPTFGPEEENIMVFETDILHRLIAKVRERGTNFFKWLKKGFKAADIIIDSLSSVPGLSFVGEFKKQLENLIPE
jgi:hypothetical protein